jgi:hypothetical protein
VQLAWELRRDARAAGAALARDRVEHRGDARGGCGTPVCSVQRVRRPARRHVGRAEGGERFGLRVAVELRRQDSRSPARCRKGGRNAPSINERLLARRGANISGTTGELVVDDVAGNSDGERIRKRLEHHELRAGRDLLVLIGGCTLERGDGFEGEWSGPGGCEVEQSRD